MDALNSYSLPKSTMILFSGTMCLPLEKPRLEHKSRCPPAMKVKGISVSAFWQTLSVTSLGQSMSKHVTQPVSNKIMLLGVEQSGTKTKLRVRILLVQRGCQARWWSRRSWYQIFWYLFLGLNSFLGLSSNWWPSLSKSDGFYCS